MDPISIVPTPPGPVPTPATPGETDGAAFEQALETAAAEEAPVASEAPPAAVDEVPADVELTKMALLMALTAPAVALVTDPALTAQTTTETQPVPDVTILVPVKKPTIPKADLVLPQPTPAQPEAPQDDSAFAAGLEGPLAEAVDLKPSQTLRTPTRVMTAETTGEVALKAGPSATASAVVTPQAGTPSPAAAPSPEATVIVAVERPAPARAEAPTPAALPAHPAPVEARGLPTYAPPSAVTEPARLAEARPTEVLTQIQHAVERMGETQLDTVRVQLNPEYLGRIELHVSHASDGALHVQVRAEQPQTVALLERHLTELRTTLSANQLDVRHVAVSAGTTGDRRQQPPFHGRPAKIAIRGLQRAELDAAAAAASTGPLISVYPTSRLALAGVDYRI